MSIQLFGQDADIMKRAAAMAAEAGADIIDLNMGCPVKKVCRTGAGVAISTTRTGPWPWPGRRARDRAFRSP